MSLQATPQVDVSAAVSVRVPRGETDNLRSGVVDVLAKVDGVTDVSVEGVTSVRPTWTDVRVDADTRLTVEIGADYEARSSDVRARLEDGFGVTDVDDLVVDAA